MVDVQILNKTDSEVLLDLQKLSLLVTGFAYVSGNPQITFSSLPGTSVRQRIREYVQNNGWKKAVVV